ncbi:hypothetical protein [Frankia sp. QA3]|uniref:hypothetical protein n=1 Tax=Frankia sp. QA3 TaxID=710111 RepID=UPI000269BEFC|nr:hypothetical protein [Frankia sp. QA3]EIV92712.1 hypothetical protein FraQA3DRAFT_2322 [Frankia sp. QA3]
MAAEEERAAVIAAVLDSLSTLGGRAPGSPLRADDWNALVAALGMVVRLSAAGDAGTPGPAAGAAGELPPGSVSMEELAPDVRNLLRSGPFADPEQTIGRFSLDRRLSAVTERLDALEARLEALLASLHRTENDVSRQGSDLRLVDQRVAGTTGLRAEVGDLRTLLGNVRADVADVLVLRQQLNGLDLAQLRANVTELTAFRDAWRDGEGQVTAFAGFSRRLTEISDRAVTDDELRTILDSRFDTFVVDPGPIRTTVTNDLRAEVLAAKEEIRRGSAISVARALADLRGSLDAEVIRVVGSQVAGLTAQLSDVAARAADERLAATRDELRAQTAQLVDGRIARLGPRVAPQDLADLEARLDTRVDAARSAGISRDEVGTLLTQARVDLGGRIDDVVAGVESNRRGQAELGATLRRERADAAAAESRRLEGLIDAQARRERLERAGAIDAAAQRVTTDLGSRIDLAAQASRAERDSAVASAVEARTAAIRGELEARVRVVAQDAVAAVESDIVDLRGQLRGLDGRLNDASRRVGGTHLRPGLAGGGLIEPGGGLIEPGGGLIRPGGDG